MNEEVKKLFQNIMDFNLRIQRLNSHSGSSPAIAVIKQDDGSYEVKDFDIERACGEQYNEIMKALARLEPKPCERCGGVGDISYGKNDDTIIVPCPDCKPQEQKDIDSLSKEISFVLKCPDYVISDYPRNLLAGAAAEIERLRKSQCDAEHCAAVISAQYKIERLKSIIQEVRALAKGITTAGASNCGCFKCEKARKILKIIGE